MESREKEGETEPFQSGSGVGKQLATEELVDEPPPFSPRTRAVTRSWTRGELNQELAKPEESSLTVK